MLSCSGLLNSASLFNFQFPRVISPGADHHRRVLLRYFVGGLRENGEQLVPPADLLVHRAVGPSPQRRMFGLGRLSCARVYW